MHAFDLYDTFIPFELTLLQIRCLMSHFPLQLISLVVDPDPCYYKPSFLTLSLARIVG